MQVSPRTSGTNMEPLPELPHGSGSLTAATSHCRRTSASLRLPNSSQGLVGQAGISLIELAIAFLLRHGTVTWAIIGPRTMEHLESWLPTAGITLPGEVL